MSHRLADILAEESKGDEITECERVEGVVDRRFENVLITRFMRLEMGERFFQRAVQGEIAAFNRANPEHQAMFAVNINLISSGADDAGVIRTAINAYHAFDPVRGIDPKFRRGESKREEFHMRDTVNPQIRKIADATELAHKFKLDKVDRIATTLNIDNAHFVCLVANLVEGKQHIDIIDSMRPNMDKSAVNEKLLELLNHRNPIVQKDVRSFWHLAEMIMLLRGQLPVLTPRTLVKDRMGQSVGGNSCWLYSFVHGIRFLLNRGDLGAHDPEKSKTWERLVRCRMYKLLSQ